MLNGSDPMVGTGAEQFGTYDCMAVLEKENPAAPLDDQGVALHQLTKVETEMAEMMAEAVTVTEIKEGLKSRLFLFRSCMIQEI